MIYLALTLFAVSAAVQVHGWTRPGPSDIRLVILATGITGLGYLALLLHLT